MGALFQSRGWLPIVEAPRYSRHPTPILPMQLLNAFKCNLKELTTKSALSAWGQRSLTCACLVAGDIDHVIHWRVQFSFVLGSFSYFLPPPPPKLCRLVLCSSREGGGLPYKRLIRLNNGFAFSIELLEWGRTFSHFLGWDSHIYRKPTYQYFCTVDEK